MALIDSYIELFTPFAGRCANAGRVRQVLVANMGNSIDQNRKLQNTYMRVNAVAVRAADEARKRGRKLLGEEHIEFKKLKLGLTKS